METKQELEQWLARLEARWAKGDFVGNIVSHDKQIREIRRRLQELADTEPLLESHKARFTH